MINGKNIVVVLPAFQAEKTVEMTFRDIPGEVVDHVLIVDDASTDRTVEIARKLGIHAIVHERNLGYGGNQKTCYTAALKSGADVVVMLHPDYQYDPRLISAMAGMIAHEVYDCVLGSRILGSTALRGGMPLYKYVANRLLTTAQNLLIGSKLSEFHTGYRAFSREILETLPLQANSDDFVFDNQMLTQIVAKNFQIGEVSCPTRYFADASSISFRRSIVYGLGVLRTSLSYRLWRWGLSRSALFSDSPDLRLDARDNV